MSMHRLQIKDILKLTPSGQTVTVNGWVRTKRESKNAIFIALNDGSTIHNIQDVCGPDQFGEDLIKQCSTGACLRIAGSLVPSQGAGQTMEVQVETPEVPSEEEIRQRVIREREAAEAERAREKEMEEESARLDKLIEQEIRGAHTSLSIRSAINDTVQ